MQRAVNTDKDIFKVGDLYYMCFQGVWFMSRTATGPWAVTGDVPAAIYTIPVSSPSHAVTYVTVEESNNDSVEFATAAAFTGAMIAFGCVVWGTGYYYPPYVWYGGGYPYYRPYYPSYGFGASYNPWTGAYTRGAVAYGPYGGAGVAQRYNPRTGTYSRGAVAYGPYGARGAASAYNPRTGTSAATRQGSNVYGSWGATGVQRGDDWAATARSTNNVDGRHQAPDGDERRRRDRPAHRTGRHHRGGQERQRRRLRRSRRQRLQEVGRRLAEVRQRRLERQPTPAATAADSASAPATRPWPDSRPGVEPPRARKARSAPATRAAREAPPRRRGRAAIGRAAAAGPRAAAGLPAAAAAAGGERRRTCSFRLEAEAHDL